MFRINLKEAPYKTAWLNARAATRSNNHIVWYTDLLTEINASDVNNPQEIDFETEEDAVAFLLKWS